MPKISNLNVFKNAFYRKELHLNYHFVICHVYRNKSNISITASTFFSICTICNKHRTIYDLVSFKVEIRSMKQKCN